MGLIVGQVQVFGTRLSLEQIEASMIRLQVEAGEVWKMAYWRNRKDQPCAARVDGWTDDAIADLKAGPAGRVQSYHSSEVFRFAPVEWNRRQPKEKSYPLDVPVKTGRRRWDLMAIGDQQIMHNWSQVRLSLLRCCVPRGIPFVFEIERVRYLESSPTDRAFRITRVE